MGIGVFFGGVNIDATIEDRRLARERKDWQASDRLRGELDARNVFAFDNKDGSQEVWHLNDRWFANMHKTGHTDRRKYVEHRMKQDREATARNEAWVYSMLSATQ